VTRITGILREDHCTFMIISRSDLLRMRNISDKRYICVCVWKSCHLWDKV